MIALRQRLRPATWLALIAVLALALVPTVSRALAFAQGEAAWTEVCTPLGSRLSALADAGDEPPAARSGPLEHCAYCAPSAGDEPLPARAAHGLPGPSVAAEGPPSSSLAAPHLSATWRGAQPRAPPARA